MDVCKRTIGRRSILWRYASFWRADCRFGDCQGDQRQIRDQRYAQCGDRPEQAHGTERSGPRGEAVGAGAQGRIGGSEAIQETEAIQDGPGPGSARAGTPAGGRTGQACAVSASARGWFTDRAQARRLRYPYGGDKDGEPIVFCGHPRRDGSSYCTPAFSSDAGPGDSI
ncbi:GcrA family cell cycle regulator [Bradyrhizobium sp.]|uniref:GcrA family cell cycle regulator n=1 Tax=Bradyrhizobium sp. TaxID=376 RepID=UPI0039C87433